MRSLHLKNPMQMYLCYLNGIKLVSDQFVNKTGQISWKILRICGQFLFDSILRTTFSFDDEISVPNITKVTQETILAWSVSIVLFVCLVMFSLAWREFGSHYVDIGVMKVNLLESRQKYRQKSPYQSSRSDHLYNTESM